jgi:hypothetical protein
MKKITKKITLLCLAIVFAFAVKAQTTCGTAVTYTYPITQTVSSYTAGTYWFQVTLGAGNYQIKVNSNYASKLIQRADVYTGTCSSLSLYETDSLIHVGDSSFIIPISNTTSTTYYVKLSVGSGGSSTFKVTSATSCLIVGDINYCPNANMQLLASILNYTSGTQTYTWTTPSSTTYTTASITLSAPAPGTYTLVYHDGSGTYTTTITTFTLPTSVCNSCELVQNNSFETYLNGSTAGAGGIFLQCTSGSGYYDPSIWYAPTCGSPDYNNANEGTVPNNLFNCAPLNAHSGKAYVGAVMYESPSYREYIEEPLKCSLINGQTYNISFYAAKSSCFGSLATSSIGAFLSTASVTATSSTGPLSYTPQITASGSITSYTTWTQISGTYVGNGEQYITIGNFNDDAHTILTGSGSVIYMYFDDISITPATPTLTASTYTVDCNSASTLTLTATGAPTAYVSWSDGVNTYTGTPVYIPYLQTNPTFTCTVSLPCSGCTPITQTITINTINNPTVSVSPSNTTTICGSSTTLTASGATTYTWNTGPTTTTISINPTSTTNYTVTGASNSCTARATATVNVSPISITITPSAPTICEGLAQTLTASGANTYSWSTSATTASVSVSPTVTTTYAVTGTNTTTTCANTQTVSVAVTSTVCAGTAIPSYTPATGTLTTSPSLINNDLYINSGVTYTIHSSDVRIAPGKTIFVNNGGKLIIEGSWLHACSTCGSMWDGISVANGGTLIIEQTATVGGHYSNNIIEDAVTAVTTASNTATTPIPSYTITNVIFNNNGDGIYINSHAGNLSGNSVTNTVFTCRKIGDHQLVQTHWNGVVSDIKAATPILTSTANPTDLTLAGARSSTGIYVNAVKHIYPINVGDSTLNSNVFDNHDYGIYCNKTSLTAKNNIFQNLTGNSSGASMFGVGIYYYTVKDTNVKILIVGSEDSTLNSAVKNTFTNCLAGIVALGPNQEYITNNYFNNETTATTFTTSGSYVTGQYGVYNNNFADFTRANAPDQMVFCNNSINNCATGHNLTFAALTNTASQSILISTNTITATGTGTQYCTYGITTSQNAGLGLGAGAGVPVDGYEITHNTITNVNSNAIWVNTVGNAAATSGFLTIDKNVELSVIYNSSASSSASPPTAAVYLSGCYYPKVSNNSNIKCTGLSGSYPSTNAQYIAGIYVYQSPNSRITCNAVTNVGECFVWNSTNTSSIWIENTMHNSRYGLTLRSTGVMGDQGGIGGSLHAIFAQFGNSDITSAQTLTDGSFPATNPTSKITDFTKNCGASSTNIPCVNVTSGGTTYSLTTSLLTTTATATYSLCTAEGGNGRFAYNHQTTASANDSLPVADSSSLAALLNFNDSLPSYANETYWATQYYVSSKMSSIAAAQGYQNAKAFALADAAIAGKDYSNAQNLIYGITTNNVIEQNWQAIDNIIIKLQSDTLNNSDISTLQSVAQQCPLTGGSIVWRARTMLNTYYNNIINYPGDCPVNNGGGSKTQNTSGIANTTHNQTITLYPNPNDGKLYISNFDANEKNVYIEITDITGKLVVKQQSQINNGLVELNLDLNNGVYLVKAINSKGSSQLNKIIISK